MKIKNRVLTIAVTASLLAATTLPVCGTTDENLTVVKGGGTPYKVAAYIKPDVTVQYDAVPLSFFDANGTAVYPIIYNGSTYLPVRAVSELMQEPIEWDNFSKTVYIGRTLSNPNRSIAKEAMAKQYVKQKVADGHNISLAASLVTVYVKPDVSILFNFVNQHFKDAQGRNTYPLIYNGSTYLPVRAISELMGEEIAWNTGTKTVSIGSIEPVTEVATEPAISEAALLLEGLYDREVDLYDDATGKISGIKQLTTVEELTALANSVSANYITAQQYNLEIKDLDTDDFTEEELAAYTKLAEFAELTEYYILVLENISYMAASESDYSMLAETFYNFAMSSSEKMDAARDAIENLRED